MSNLHTNGLEPVIVGSVAVYNQLSKTRKHCTNLIAPPEQLDLAIARQEIGMTRDLDLFVSKVTLPALPKGWRKDHSSIGVPSWISPSGGYVDFLLAGSPIAGQSTIPKKIRKDDDSEKLGCPIADLQSIFELKLDSSREKDRLDLTVLAKAIGIPRQFGHLSARQRDNLEYIKLFASL